MALLIIKLAINVIITAKLLKLVFLLIITKLIKLVFNITDILLLLITMIANFSYYIQSMIIEELFINHLLLIGVIVSLILKQPLILKLRARAQLFLFLALIFLFECYYLIKLMDFYSSFLIFLILSKLLIQVPYFFLPSTF